MPSGEADIIVELIARIPPEHDVAETEAALERRHEFLAGEVFPPQHAVHVENPELDVAHIAFTDDLRGICRGPDLVRLHTTSFPLVCRPEQCDGFGVRSAPPLSAEGRPRSGREGGITTRVTKHPLLSPPPQA